MTTITIFRESYQVKREVLACLESTNLEARKVHWEPDLELKLSLAGVVLDELVLVQVQVVINQVQAVPADEFHQGVGGFLDKVAQVLLNLKVGISLLGLKS